MTDKRELTVDVPRAYVGLYRPHRYKVFYGGRGGGKSHQFASALVILSRSRNILILCAREFQNSIADSVHCLLERKISDLSLDHEFLVHKTEIAHKLSGSRFIFKGVRHNAQEIKSTEGVDICWIEEAGAMSRESFDILVPTIRKPDSEIWISFNPERDTDAVYDRFVKNPPPDGSIVKKVGWRDNPWFPGVLERERRWLLQQDPEAYAWVWEGECRKFSENLIYRNVIVEPFAAPEDGFAKGDDTRFFYGLDWGFAVDPFAGVRAFVHDGKIHIDHEAYGFDIGLDELAEYIRGALPGIDSCRAYGDSSRPETIEYLSRRAIPVKACTKKKGSIEDGISYLQSFRQIVVHPRCENTAREFRLYRYLVDRSLEQVVRKPEDKNNHCMDALRYAFDAEINGKADIVVPDELIEDYEAGGRFKRGQVALPPLREKHGILFQNSTRSLS